jgi:UDP-3-O-[3-hydroxymyristoyl] glucosamine N-acyltransferase
MRIKDLTKRLDIRYEGEDFEIASINTLIDAKRDEISFFDNKKYLEALKASNAGAIFIKEEFLEYLPKDSFALICDDPYLSMARASRFFAKELYRENLSSDISDAALIAKSAHIGNGVKIEKDVVIMDGVVIGDEVKIGEGSVIYPNVTVYNDTVIGRGVIIHAGSVIGSDGFGYAHTKDGKHIKIYHNGRVKIEDFVEIGANTTIDRAVFGKTLIKEGTKIDNLVQIGHNCEIGVSSIIVSQVGLSGSTKLGKNVIMGGQSATSGHLSIGDFATIAARGGVTKSIEGGKTYSGFPLMLHSDWLKLQAKLQKFFKKG